MIPKFGSSLIAIRDNVSGDIIGHVSSLADSSSVTNVGGVAREVVRRSGDEVFVGRPEPDVSDCEAGHRPTGAVEVDAPR